MAKNRGNLVLLLLACWLVIYLPACKQARDLKAFTEASYALVGVNDAMVNGIGLMDKYGPKDFTPGQGDSLLAAIYSNKLRFSATLALHVKMQEPEVARTMTITNLKWLLLIDGKEVLTGEATKTLRLQDGLNNLPVVSTVTMAEAEGLPNYEGLSKLVTIIGRRGDLRKHLTFKIKPTIKTPVGNVEVPRYITVSQPAVEPEVALVSP